MARFPDSPKAPLCSFLPTDKARRESVGETKSRVTNNKKKECPCLTLVHFTRRVDLQVRKLQARAKGATWETKPD